VLLLKRYAGGDATLAHQVHMESAHIM